MEEHLDESRAQLESEADGWKARLEKAKLGEREKSEQVRELQGEVKKMRDEQKGAKGRLGEMEVALQEVRGALEGARGEIEGLRGEAGVSTVSPLYMECEWLRINRRDMVFLGVDARGHR